MTCTVTNCDKPLKALGYCGAHYRRNRLGMDMTAPLRRYGGPNATCTIADCDKPHATNGYCQMHERRRMRNGDPNVTRRDWGHGKTAAMVGYAGAHDRVYKARGKASDQPCGHCGQAAQQWAYNHSDPNEQTELIPVRGLLTPMEYSTDPMFYVPLCQPCHRVFDGRELPQRNRQSGRFAA